ncbi:Uncharacterized conserved protein (DUF2358) [Seminavis robusta]|uniref:Uncharacterized conserved protein (DUF2358) n=1 Tax=Seminavis robusta TaxID=568900 RepID=A0A9N8EQW5_9STRA|nr:Uncharacterized conserved protein (DUF2358) [Seminavis robusta]|eukprot:Sro1440_g272840.1 Uncharacterized conserved protein (DUF2358) (272) ;mRNA; r:8968-9783
MNSLSCAKVCKSLFVGLVLCSSSLSFASAFLPASNHASTRVAVTQVWSRQQQEQKESSSSSISYEETDASSKGIVSSLTGMVNFLSFNNNDDVDESSNNNGSEDLTPPQTPDELLERIRDDYVVRNYLWTGDIDLASFDKQCRFTDPTLSFQGTDQFVQNLNNLVPIVDALIGDTGNCQSDLLDIQLNREKGYVQSRWNMVGSLARLPWKPKIDVIGRTKFWYKTLLVDDDTTTTEGYQVYFYDEEWEIPAAKALLQLITPPGTIQNSNQQ